MKEKSVEVMSYAILLNEIKKFDFEKGARILSKAEGIIYADATFRLRNSLGILTKDLPYEEVEMITNELNDAGIGCFFMDMKDFYNPPPPYTLNSAYLSDDLFGAINLFGNIQPCSWSNIVLLSCGHITEEKVHQERKFSGPGFSPAARVYRAIERPEAVKKVVEIPHWYFDIFSRQPQEKHLRIISNGFNYDFLGDRKQEHSNKNFPLLVEDICKYAASAFSNRGIRGLLKTPSEKTVYRSLKEFDDENFWLLQLTYLNLKNNQ